MVDKMLQLMVPVLEASSPEAASLAFFKVAAPFGATYLQTRKYRRPAGLLTPSSHLAAGGVVIRVAPPSWTAGNLAFDYVCLTCNPLVDAIRQGLTRYRFSDFAPRDTRAFGAYWNAFSEARIADAICATAYGRRRRIASLHLGFDQTDIDPELASALHMAGLMLAETLMRFDDDGRSGEEDAPDLTARERDSLCFVAEGKTDWEIATILGVSETTARFHVDNARRKLGAVNRAHAVARFLAADGLQ